MNSRTINHNIKTLHRINVTTPEKEHTCRVSHILMEQKSHSLVDNAANHPIEEKINK